MTTDENVQELAVPAWDPALELRERAQAKDPDLCAWPGCDRERAEPTGGRPPRYCLQAHEGELPHTRLETSRARRNAPPADPEPVSSAVFSASRARTESVALLGRQSPTIAADLVEALVMLADDDALELEWRATGRRSSERRVDVDVAVGPGPRRGRHST